MIHHLILSGQGSPELNLSEGILQSGERRIALQVLGSVQCFSREARWTQHSLCRLAQQCPVILACWSMQTRKWNTTSLLPRCRYVNPACTYRLCNMPERRSKLYIAALLYAKVQNQHTLLRALSPEIAPLPKLAANSCARILQLEALWARNFWPRYFQGASQDLFAREKRRARAPINVALNYGYAFLYHALEWQCIACGLEPGIGFVHHLRRNRPSLVCDLIEPFRCCVEITLMRYLDEMHETKLMAGRFAEMLESPWSYAGKRFRLRSIIRLATESFARAVIHDLPATFRPFVLHARDACL